MIQIRENEEKIVLRCNETIFGLEDIKDLEQMVQSKPEKKVVVNLEGVSSIKNSALSLLKKISEQNKLSLCSLDADIFAVINLLNYDKAFNIYPTEISSIEEKNELINRRFKVV